jgi:hypothetical protein
MKNKILSLFLFIVSLILLSEIAKIVIYSMFNTTVSFTLLIVILSGLYATGTFSSKKHNN